MNMRVRGKVKCSVQGQDCGLGRCQAGPEALLLKKRLQSCPVEADDELPVDLRHRRRQVPQRRQFGHRALIARDVPVHIRDTVG